MVGNIKFLLIYRNGKCDDEDGVYFNIRDVGGNFFLKGLAACIGREKYIVLQYIAI